MEHNPLISIITPTFNHERYIGTCIESVRAQTYEHWELLIVNDGSTDDTSRLAHGYAAQDERIRVFDRENVGIHRLKETYNFALERANGSLIGILEGDDVWLETKLDTQMSAFESTPDAVLCWGEVGIINHNRVLENGDRSDRDRLPIQVLSNDPVGLALSGLYFQNFVPALTMLIRKDALEKIGGFQQTHDLPLVDYPTLLRLATLGRFAVVDDEIAMWRSHHAQITKTYYTDIVKKVRLAVLDHYDSIDNDLRSRVGVQREEIETHYQRLLHRAYFLSGRYRLLQSRFRDARSDFSKALWYPGGSKPLIRLGALLGIALSLLGLDLEWIARLLRKTDLSS